MTSIFLKKYVIPMINATSTVKSVSQGTANVRTNRRIGSGTPSARPKWVWHPGERLKSI